VDGWMDWWVGASDRVEQKGKSTSSKGGGGTRLTSSSRRHIVKLAELYEHLMLEPVRAPLNRELDGSTTGRSQPFYERFDNCGAL
jgi:hypothetical protein